MLLTAIGAAAAASIAISLTRPFTWQADLVTAIGIFGVVCGGTAALRASRARLQPGYEGLPGPLGRTGVTRRAAGAWITVGAAITAFELLSLFSEPRRAHPTISSLLGLLTAHSVTKGLLFAAWLAIGCWTWSAGPGAPEPSPDDGRARA